MNREHLEEQLDCYLEYMQEILPAIEFKLDKKKKHIGYNFKYAPKGGSHHWISFGIIHEPKLEYWLNIGAIKFEDDFQPIKEKLLEIQKSKIVGRSMFTGGFKAFDILDKKGEFFIRGGVEFDNLEETEVKKGLNKILDIAKYAINELKGTGFLGIEKIDITEPAKSVEENTIKCRACQTELEADDKFCSSCGEKVTNEYNYTDESVNKSKTENKISSEEYRKKIEEQIANLYDQEKFESAVELFESNYNWESDVIKQFSNGNWEIDTIDYYLWSLYRLDGREEEVIIKSKEFLNSHNILENSNIIIYMFKSILSVYIASAKYINKVEELKIVLNCYILNNGDNCYNEQIEELKGEINKVENPGRNVFKIEFNCKLKRKVKGVLGKMYEKGKVINADFYYITNLKNLTKSDCVDVLYSKCNSEWAIRHWVGNSIVYPHINGWEDLTNPTITNIELIGKESDYMNALENKTQGEVWND